MAEMRNAAHAPGRLRGWRQAAKAVAQQLRAQATARRDAIRRGHVGPVGAQAYASLQPLLHVKALAGPGYAAPRATFTRAILELRRTPPSGWPPAPIMRY